VSTGAAILAFLGLFVAANVVVGVLILLNRVLRPLREIKRYADDILAAGLGIARNLDGIDEAARLHELATALPAGVRKAVE
jgi:HAMP domain-containing protein